MTETSGSAELRIDRHLWTETLSCCGQSRQVWRADVAHANRTGRARFTEPHF
jgi:hypothetical protein